MAVSPTRPDRRARRPQLRAASAQTNARLLRVPVLRSRQPHENIDCVVGLRPYSDDVEGLAALWYGRCETTGDDWKETSRAGDAGGEASGYFVTSGTLNGYAKPSKIDSNPKPYPRAAHEKIAADLAFMLGLPLPPVLLQRWPAAPPQGDQRFVAISLRPFLNVHKWEHITAVPAVAEQMKLELKPVASALVPFDTWLDNGDRSNGGNLIVSKDGTDPAKPLRVAYIDYSNSMVCEWRNRPFTDIPLRPIYPTDQKDADVSVMADILWRIEVLPSDTIQTIVGRIPDDFATQAMRSQILDGLLHRKSRVHAVLKTVYGGIA